MKNAWVPLATVCALVIGVYACMVQPGLFERRTSNTADATYNLLVGGFRDGRLSLNEDVPSGFAQLADPYDPITNERYRHGSARLHDLSYYKGKLYLYFGITPAVMLFWPYVALTGHYLSQRSAGVIFCAVGFLAGAGLLGALWRRYFAEVSVAVVAACMLTLGLATFMPLLLARCYVYEVSISCGYALTMLALAAIWKALHEPERRGGWLAAASLTYGLAVGARPSLLCGAVILLVPVAQAWTERRTISVLLLTAIAPITLIGLGLMSYNAQRFDNPFEFGWHYQLAMDRQIGAQLFSPRFLWFNLRVYFLEPAHWNHRFPFVQDISVPPLPAGHGRVEHPFGVLANIPLVWLALAVPLAWRGRPAGARSVLRGFLAAVVLLFGIITLTISLFCVVCTRYEVEFLSPLVLLAAIGVLSLERALAPTPESGPGCRPVWRHAARWGWCPLVGLSVTFSLLASCLYCAEARYNLGGELAQAGRVTEAMAQYEQALRIEPDYAEAHLSLGNALVTQGRVQDAIAHYEEALRIKPDYLDAHESLGNVLMQRGALPEAIEQYERALRINPHLAEAHNNLGTALGHTGKIEEAIAEFEQAVRINPDFAEAHNNLGIVLARTAKTEAAIAHFEKAVRIQPNFAEAHYNLGKALAQVGRVTEAIEEYEQALRIQPNFTQAQEALAHLQTGRQDGSDDAKAKCSSTARDLK
ncbi:MAG TPA: tetratricopeptide repeat protein [Verrucomicrobiae bacterium]|nr:tetratricopeptide repeat protein [Verrucomicrobiae bacterium]